MSGPFKSAGPRTTVLTDPPPFIWRANIYGGPGSKTFIAQRRLERMPRFKPIRDH